MNDKMNIDSHDQFDPFGFPGMNDLDDPFGNQQAITPDFDSFKTTGTNKLLVVLFVVDCSRSMDGDRIMAVNAALTEIKSTLQDIKNDNGLDLKIAIMSFTSSAKWELQLTDIDEVSLENLKTRPGLTEYGTAFHELNKVLRKEQYMKHTGKISPPAIMFLTDGGPTDDYEADLEDLLKNGWFANASRSAVLLGDAIHDANAKKAVSKFVEDPDNDIVDAENSTVIIQKIKIATMHTVAGDPIDKGIATGPDDVATNPAGSDTTSGKKGGIGKDFADPFGGAGGKDFSDPFGGADGKDSVDPFGGADGVNWDDPFGSDGTIPFGPTDGSNPF